MIWMDVDTALAAVPVNACALIDDTDFKTREESVTYDQAGMDLVWNFVTSAGAYTQTAVTPTTAGVYDWTNKTNGMYAIEIPASGGASINNDTEGYGWFTGYATGILPWTGPIIGFRASGLNDLLCDSAYSTTRGLSGTALPAAAADAAGGLPISDAGGLDMDAILADTNELQADDYPTTLATLATSAALATAQTDLDTITGATGVNLLAATQASIDAIEADTGTDGVVIATGGVSAAALATDAAQEIRDTIFQGTLTEGYATDGSAAKLQEILYMIYSVVAQFAVSGTSVTCKKIDGTTTSMIFTLDDGTNPTLRDRTS